MKKINFRSVSMVFLITASVASYTFLSTVEIENVEETAIELEKTNLENNDSKIFMPDVEFVKKVVAIGKAALYPFSK